MKSWIVNFALGILLALPVVVFAQDPITPDLIASDPQYPPCCKQCNAKMKCAACKKYCKAGCSGDSLSECVANCDAFTPDGSCPD